MKVWIVDGVIAYTDGSDIIGAYATPELAQAASDKAADGFDSMYVTEFEVVEA